MNLLCLCNFLSLFVTPNTKCIIKQIRYNGLSMECVSPAEANRAKLKSFLHESLTRIVETDKNRVKLDGMNPSDFATLVLKQLDLSLGSIDREFEPVDAKVKNRQLQTRGAALLKSFGADSTLISRFLGQSIDVDTICNNYVANKVKNKRVFEDIVSHHSNIATFESWEAATKSGIAPALENYATAASAMGEKAWVRAGNEWIESTILKHCHRSDPDEKIRLLDVGSCYNPFQQCANAVAFAVTALDLCPANESVYVCDFLKVSVGPANSSIAVSPILAPTDSNSNSNVGTKTSESDLESPEYKVRRLIAEGSSVPIEGRALYSNNQLEIVSLPMESFDAVAMSLVLSYLPSPVERQEMLRKARSLLREDGLLLVFEKESVFHTGRYFPLFLSNWKAAVEALGFSLVKYTALSTPSALGGHSRVSHAFAFSASKHCAAKKEREIIRLRNCRSDEAPILWMKQDFQRVNGDGKTNTFEDIVLQTDG